jgi:cytochrome oxidase Cu insertion factor (SCO1/SenC/PrrC family)
MATIGVGSLLAFRRAPAPQIYWTLPAFHLIDQDGRAFGSADLSGHPWLAAFVFTRCGGTCPIMTARMARLQAQLPAATRLLSITVDPAHDTPAVLKAYATDVHAGANWHFLTGRQDELYRLAADGFKLEAAEVPAGRAQPDDGPFLHSSKLALVDGAGRVRGYYDSDDDSSMDKLLADARLLDAGR